MDEMLINLNLIYDYPVRWSKYKVLRDFVQNFYDAVKYHEWHERFSYQREGDELVFKAKDVGFSYDWLLHIGASTKRDEPGEYAGYFGEGFKIASLCALRDYGWQIEMASKEWELVVVTSQLEVDGRFLTSLAYRVWKKEQASPDTVLRIRPFLAKDDEILQSVLLSFFYPQNPLFGEKIWDSNGAAVFYRSTHPKPRYYPSTHDYGGKGIIFAGYQALGSFDYPLIFCLHGYRFNDRERNTFFKMDVVKIIRRAVEQLPPKSAADVLEIFKRKWYAYPKKRYDFETWYSIIRTLAFRVARSHEQKERWKQTYPNLLVARRVKRNDIPNYNKRKQALAWLRSSTTKYRLVQDGFSALGYPSLEEMCQKDDGFTVTRDPNEQEAKMIELLELLTKIILADLFQDVELPECKIVKHESAVWTGMATCIPLKKPIKVPSGMKIRYRLSHIAIKSSLLTQEHFGAALSTYLHEIAHMFGSDSSASFSKALTEILDIALSNTQIIEAFREKWRETAIK